MPEMIMFIGLPGSGKSTYFQKHPEFSNTAVRLSLDDFRFVISGQDYLPQFEPVVHSWAEMTGRYLMSQGYNVLIDATSVRKGLRQKWCKLAREYRFKTKAIWFDVPYFTCVERNNQRKRKVPEEVLRRMSEDFEEPSKDEGFDEILKVNE